MRKIFLILGAVIFIFGLVDLGGSYANFDLWGKIGVQLPEMIWQYSAYIEMAIGAVLFGIGKGTAESED
ncbi:MAG: hypothetical protein CR975_06765 [Gammaproteobacteria bacterium]|nr:MAG: hypothetical protein CR975_06765 [Gammaproteobacteria bacterium]